MRTNTIMNSDFSAIATAKPVAKKIGEYSFTYPRSIDTPYGTYYFMCDTSLAVWLDINAHTTCVSK